MARWVLMLFFFVAANLAMGHTRNNSFIDIVHADGDVSGVMQLRLEDLPLITALDTDRNQQLTWGEVLQARDAITRYIDQNFHISSGNQVCALAFEQFQLQQLAGGTYLYIPLAASCPAESAALDIGYSLFFTVDAAHRGLIKVESDEASVAFVFAPSQQQFNVGGEESSTLAYMLTFVEEGVWHIWTGYDHLLFLLALLIPLFAYGRADPDSDANTLKPIFIKVLKLVTAFTVAHSITLIATSIYQPAFAPAMIETLIAFSVLVAGVNMLWPFLDKGHWRIAFGFGLLHGLGFASALSGLVLPTDYFIECLLSFNLGVELGQLAIVLPCIPLLLLLSRQFYYRTLAMPFMALAVISCSLWWTVERAAGI